MTGIVLRDYQATGGQPFVSWLSTGTGDLPPPDLPIQRAYCFFCPNRPRYDYKGGSDA